MEVRVDGCSLMGTVLVLQDENSGDWLHNNVIILNTNELYSEKWYILYNVNFTTIRKIKFHNWTGLV